MSFRGLYLRQSIEVLETARAIAIEGGLLAVTVTAVAKWKSMIAQKVRNLLGNTSELRNALIAYLLGRYKHQLDAEGDVLIIAVGLVCGLPATGFLTLDERAAVWNEAGDYLNTLGEIDKLRAIIRECRQKSELGIEHLAKALGIPESDYIAFENGGRLPVTVSYIQLS